MIYVMSDIHGEKDRYDAMLELIRFSDEDTLIVIGDVIDRGPQGVDILKDIMRRPNVKFLIGNHELMMLETFWSGNDYDARRLWTYNGGGETYRTLVYKTSTEERLRILRFIIHGKRSRAHLRMTVLYSPMQTALPTERMWANTSICRF